MSKIIKIHAREILDSRGFPTVEVDVLTDRHAMGRACVPSGASTGELEALELRDNDKKRYCGKGVLKAVGNINKILGPKLIEQNFFVFEQMKIDHYLNQLDGTENKSKYGANAILGISLAVAKTAAKETCTPLYRYLGGSQAHILPTPMLNIVNGGAHADNSIDFQEFMIVPGGAKSFHHALQMASEVYQALKKLLKRDQKNTSVGDEGGFAPDFNHVKEVLDYITEAISLAGYKPGRSGKNACAIAIDGACSELFNKKDQKYYFKKHNKRHQQKQSFSSEDLINVWEDLCKKYPIISIEDGLAEHDWDNFCKLQNKIGDEIQIVGDDLFVTNPKYIQKGIRLKAANSVLIKINQIGTLSETINAINLAKQNKWTAVVSHRSGETEDTTIADLCVGLNTGQIKTGSISRTDRICKYNQLLRIEEELGEEAKYIGFDAFYSIKKT